MAKYNFYEYEKLSKLKLEDAPSMYDWLEDYNHFSTDYRTWKDKNVSNISLRSYTEEDLRMSPYYDTLKKGTERDDYDLLHLRFDYDEFKKIQREINEKSSNKILNSYVQTEKDRIEKQSESREYNREDHFAIGTVYLNIPPAQINISEEKHNLRFNYLRSKGETILSTGRSTTRIDLTLYFNGYNDINDKLRPLLAQFKTTPFLPIENEHVNNVLNPYGKQAEEVETEEIERTTKLNELIDERNKNREEIVAITEELRAKGYLGDDVNVSDIRYPELIPREQTDDEDYRLSWYGGQEVDLRTYLSKRIDVLDKSDIDILFIEEKMTRIQFLQDNIDRLNRDGNHLFNQAIDKRYIDKQVIGALSQISVTTMPGYPDTLLCKITMYLFNYNVFTNLFAFISTEEKNNWTLDISKCDLFIEWYVKRFLSDKEDIVNPGLKKMVGDDTMIFRFIRDENPTEGVRRQTKNDYTIREFAPDSNTVVNGITVSFKNIIKFIPILSHKTPTCQYLGSYSNDVVINFQTTNRTKLNELSRMIEDASDYPRKANFNRKSSFMFIKNELLALCGMKYFVVNSYSIDTVPDNPGLFSISLVLAEYKLALEEAQNLRRTAYVKDKELKKIARFLLEGVHKYFVGGQQDGAWSYYARLVTGLEARRWSIHWGSEFKSGLWYNKSQARQLTNKGVLYNYVIAATQNDRVARLGVDKTNRGPRLRIIFQDERLGEIYGETLPKLVSSVNDYWSNYPIGTDPSYARVSRFGMVDLYEQALIDSFEGKTDSRLFYDNLDILSDIFAKFYDTELKKMALEEQDNPLIYEFLEKSRDDPKDEVRKSYCYPDLDLPRYVDIPEEFRYKNTYREAGVPAPEANPDSSPQTNLATVDADFFFYKGSLWNDVLDKDYSTQELLKIAFENMNTLRIRNKEGSLEAIPEDKFARALAQDPETIAIAAPMYNIDPEMALNSNEINISEYLRSTDTYRFSSLGLIIDPQRKYELIDAGSPYAVDSFQQIKLRMGNEDFINSIINAKKTGFGEDEEDLPKVGIIETDFTLRNNNEIKKLFNDKFLGIPFTNSISGLITNNSTLTKENDTVYRFDRNSIKNLELLKHKLRENQKDDIFRMSRAFPAFKLYIIEEDSESEDLYDDPYEYGAVRSIEVVKSRKEAADVAVVEVVNTKGNLDTSALDDYSKEGKWVSKRQESQYRRHQETEKEQELQNFVLKPGTRIQIKMGYHSDPELLDIVFNGMVAEVDNGDIITIVAQGYGVELLHKVEKDSYSVYLKSKFKLLAELMTLNTIRHFGGKSAQVQSKGSSRKRGRRELGTPATGFREPTAVRQMFRFFKDMIPQHEADDNIYTPEVSWLGNIFGGGKITFITKNYTIWDVFEDVTRSMPGYISTVLPYDYRATMYFGPPDWTYQYTSRKTTRWDKIWRENERTNDEIIDDMKANNLIRKIDKDSPEMNRALNLLNKHLNKIYQDNPSKDIRDKVKNVVKYVDRENRNITDGRRFRNAMNSLVTVLMADLNENYPEDYDTKRSLEFIKRVIDSRNNKDFIARGTPIPKIPVDTIASEKGKKNPTYPFEIEMIGDNEDYYYDDAGNIWTTEDLANQYNEKRRNYFNDPVKWPDRKLVRNYYFKDSFHHIILNNIIASERYMYNEVTVEWAKNKHWVDGKKLITNPPKKAKTKIKADDTIWPEKVKEAIIVERNARNRIDSWLYGLSDLWAGMREMYQGELMILGDGAIKPYDFVYIYDDYNQMYGAIEVEQVVHRFDQNTGFTTTIKPDLICFVNNSIELGEALLASNYLPGYARFLVYGGLTDTKPGEYERLEGLVVREKESFWDKITAGFRTGTAGLTYKISNFQVGRREPIGLMPLIYNGNPYLAGLEGFNTDTLVQSIGGRWERFTTRLKEGLIGISEKVGAFSDKWEYRGGR